MADFTLLATPTDAVLSVNGNTGAITAAQLAAAIEAASDSNTFTDADHTKLNGISASANNYSISTDLLDEDNFATNSATKVASQQSIKAYVDANSSSVIDEDDFASNSATVAPSQQSVKAYVDTADALKANLSGATFTGDVVFTGDSANVTWDKSTDDLIFNDNAKAIFGTSSDGISLYHNGSHSYIDDQGTGHLIIKTSELDVMNVAGNEDMIKATQNGSVELFWDNSKKAEVVSWGLNILGNCGVGDNSKFQCGDSQDLQIWHGSNSYIDNSTGLLYVRGADTYISNANGTENIARFASNGAVENYFDNDLKLKTTSAGAVSKGSLGISTQATGNPVENDTPTLAFFGAADDTTTSARIQAKFIGTQSGSSNPTELNFYTKPASLGPGSHPLLALTLDKDQNATVTGTVSDSKGDLRSIPANAKTGAYTLTASDAGKFIPNTTGGWTIPNSVMSTGDAVTLINDSGSDQTITQGTNHTIYNTADGSTGTRTLAARGIATLIWQNSSVSYISGAGLS